MNALTAPAAGGLYDPAYEHDACGVGMVADLHGRQSHRIVEQGLTVLERLDHRGASGAEVATGDGSGILIQVPHRLLVDVAGFGLPDPGDYATGLAFLPQDTDDAAKARTQVEAIAHEEGLAVLGWRELPVEATTIGATAKRAQPRIEQLFVARAAGGRAVGGERAVGGTADDGLALERLAFVVRKRVEHAVDGVYFPSLSTRTIVYKGMLTSFQLREFFPELSDERVESGMALVHSRFSTNTFPSWPLAHPYRYLAHNGEINTLAGNRNWMRAREALLATDLIPGDLARIYPICTPGASDSASFDEVLELLHLGGRPLPHAVLMMIPEAWENHESMDPARRAFYRYHASLMEPWDGPAAVAFTDGTVVGAVLDRNGLRPARYWVTDDGLVVLASEVGVLDLDPATVVRKGRLQPGRMFLVDTAEGRIVDDDEIKATLAAEHPYADWLAEDQVRLEDLPARSMLTPQHASVVTHQRLFGYTTEELRIIVGPMAKTGAEPIGSMGSDASIAVLSDRSRLLYDYFTQLFAQVTNPPLDAIREELVTSLAATVGPEGNLLEATQGSCRQIVLPRPVIDRRRPGEADVRQRVRRDAGVQGVRHRRPLPGRHRRRGRPPDAEGGRALAAAIDNVRSRVSAAIADGANLIVLSDRNSTTELAPIPSLLLTAAVHHHLVRERTRTEGRPGRRDRRRPRGPPHGAADRLRRGRGQPVPRARVDRRHDRRTASWRASRPRQAHKNYVKAACKGVLKVMSKMGISTVASYTGAQVFEAVGLDPQVIDEYFTGTASRIGGVGLDVLAAEVATPPPAGPPRPADRAGAPRARGRRRVPVAARRRAPPLQPEDRLQAPARHPGQALRDLQGVHHGRRRPVRRSWRRCGACSGWRRPPVAPIPIDEVEPVVGDHEAVLDRRDVVRLDLRRGPRDAGHRHEPDRRQVQHRRGRRGPGPVPSRTPTATSRRSAVKQVASGRFGVTSEYLVNADDIQIKIAQGAKPGEGGQLPGHKVYPWIARTRYSTPGVGLISPPPHHDIYSIEDLAQLIHDLKNGQPAGPGPREAGRRGRRRHRRRRRRQGPRRRRPHLRPRRRDRRGAAHLAEARRHPVGARPGRDPADADGATACATGSSSRSTAR